MSPTNLKLVLGTLVTLFVLVKCQVDLNNVQPTQNSNNNNYPYYLQSPIGQTTLVEATLISNEEQQSANIAQRSQVKSRKPHTGGARKLDGQVTLAGAEPVGLGPTQSGSQAQASKNATNNRCLYDKAHFMSLDQCLMKRPYPTIGLPAFKNEDLLLKRGLNEKQGCLFILNNGLFKNFNINKYSLSSDNQCLDNSKVSLSLNFNNITLAYLWTLRCLNRADQLLEDSSFNGKTNEELLEQIEKQSSIDEGSTRQAGVCIGSSQNFGFASLQLSSIEAQMDLSPDIYKNWRITNTTVAMSPLQTQMGPSSARASSISAGDFNGEQDQLVALGTNIRDYVFELLDGDELNWRYLQLYQNWSRNRMHANFIEQFRRFLWISMQRCLKEESDKLAVDLVDLFGSQRIV